MAGGVELATAYVSLVVEGSKVAPGVRDALGTADGEAARSGDRAGRSFTSKFGSALKIGATLGAAFAVTKGVQFLGDAIAEAREASVTTARTTNVIKSMGIQSRITAKDVGDLATSISNKVGQDDEAIQSGLNMLLTFKNLSTQTALQNGIFKDASGLMVDYATVMETDTKSAAISLGKALNDPVKGMAALGRVGVQFSEDQTKAITKMTESGNLLGAQKIILGELEHQFQGAGEAMATPADKAKVAWDNLKEQLGTELLPTVDRVLTWLSDKGIPKVSQFFDEFRKGEGTAGDVKDALTHIKDEAVQFFDEFKNHEGFGGDVRDVMEDVADAVKSAAGHAKDFVGWFNDMPDWAKKVIIGGGVAAMAGSKLGLGKLAGGFGGSALGGLGQAVGLARPVPVFVTNQGFGVGGGAGLPGGKGGKGALLPLGLALPALGSEVITAEESGIQHLTGALAKANQAYLDIVSNRTGITDVADATKMLDDIFAGMTLEKPRQGFSALWNLSQKTGMSMDDLRAILPETSQAIEDSGVKARGTARETGAWKDIILDTGKAVDHVDGKRPNVPWLFPGLTSGIDDTGKLGKGVDDVGKKRPKVPFEFPNLTLGLFNVQTLGRSINNLPDRKTIVITTFHNDAYGGLAGGGGHEPKQPAPSKTAPKTVGGTAPKIALDDDTINKLGKAIGSDRGRLLLAARRT